MMARPWRPQPITPTRTGADSLPIAELSIGASAIPAAKPAD